MPNDYGNWWQRSSIFGKFVVIIIIMLVVIIFLGLVVWLFITLYQLNKSETAATRSLLSQSWPGLSKALSKRRICFTPSCIKTAHMVLEKMKPDINPCENFYEFACGKFMDDETIPEGRGALTMYDKVRDMLIDRLRDIVNEKFLKTDKSHLHLPHKLYIACMNETLIESLGYKPIANITEALGGWPVIKGDAWDTEDTWTFSETIKKLRHFGFSVNSVFNVAVLTDGKAYKIYIDQAVTGMSRKNLLNGFNDPSVSAYFDYMVDMAVLFGASRKQAKTEMRRSLQFEINLAKVSWSIDERQNKTLMYKQLIIKHLQEEYPYIQWLDYIKSLMTEGIEVDEDEIVVVVVPSFFERLGNVLTSTPKRDIANYMMWRVHAYSASYMSLALRSRKRKYITKSLSSYGTIERWRECLDVTVDSLKLAVASVYRHKYFKETWRDFVLEIYHNIRDTFIKTLQESKWMDPITKNGVVKKIRAITPYIAFPDELLYDEMLEKFYENVEINPHKYFESYLELQRRKQNDRFAILRRGQNNSRWMFYLDMTAVNTFYYWNDNSIFVSGGLLDGYFFQSSRPKYMNYGSIGTFIAHEIIHALGRAGFEDWCQPDSREAYLQKLQCLIKQYSNYKDRLTGLQLNGSNTLNENMADVNGIKISYLSYKHWLGNNGPEIQLPGLDYTAEQMFWIAAAQTHCAKYRPEFLKYQIKNGVHSPEHFRVFGPVSNMKQFSKDFHCPEGSSMNAVYKCIYG